MLGTDAISGQRVAGIDHLRQSIRDILTTPIGSRVMRRDYGSRLYQLVDAPMNRATILDLYAATYEALSTWEPRLDLQEIRATAAMPGNVVLTVSGIHRPDGTSVTLDGLEIVTPRPARAPDVPADPKLAIANDFTVGAF